DVIERDRDSHGGLRPGAARPDPARRDAHSPASGSPPAPRPGALLKRRPARAGILVRSVLERRAAGMGARDVVLLVVVLGGAGALGARALRPEGSAPARPEGEVPGADLRPIIAEVDAAFRREWAEQALAPVAPAPELAVMRRLALALTGAIPSLEEIR